MDANSIKFRCSSLGYIMTEPRSKTEILSETCKTHLVDVFISHKYGRREDISGKHLDKGNEREEDSITLLSRVNRKFYKKNDIRLSNDFIQGECDVYEGEEITKATHTLDTKTSWSAHTFFRSQNKKLDDMYFCQGQGYMWLTGATKHTVAYCLVNGTPKAIMDEKKKLLWSMSENDSAYKEKCKQIEINHIFNLGEFINENPNFDLDNSVADWNFDIPMNDRLFQFRFERDEDVIERFKKRIIDCREWMNKNLYKTELIKTI